MVFLAHFTLTGTTLVAELDDSTATRAFLALLPLALVLEDFAATEKIADLPSRLAIDGAPEGYKPTAGDITFYAHWGNLALFHKDYSYARGLVRLGRFMGDIAPLRVPGSVEVMIEP